MSDVNLLYIGILVFCFLAIGLILTGIEFKKIEQEQADERNIHEITRQTLSDNQNA